MGLEAESPLSILTQKEGPKVKDLSHNLSVFEADCFCSHDSPQSLVNGGAGRHVHLPLLVDAIPLTSLAIHHEADNSDFFHMQSRPVLRL